MNLVINFLRSVQQKKMYYKSRESQPALTITDMILVIFGIMDIAQLRLKMAE